MILAADFMTHYSQYVVLQPPPTIHPFLPKILQDLLCSSDKSAAMFAMRFAPPKCKMMLQEWVGVTLNLSINGQFMERVDMFTYLGSCITPDGSIAEELSSRIQKARQAFSNLHHLWRRNDIKLSTKGRVYSAAVRSVLLYGSELTTEGRCTETVGVRSPLSSEYR